MSMIKYILSASLFFRIGNVCHSCEGEIIAECTDPSRVPKFGAFIFNTNQHQIGKVSEVFGPKTQLLFSIKLSMGIKATSVKPHSEIYLSPERTLSARVFDPKPKPAPILNPEDKKQILADRKKKSGKFPRAGGGDRRGGDRGNFRGGNQRGGFNRSGDRGGRGGNKFNNRSSGGRGGFRGGSGGRGGRGGSRGGRGGNRGGRSFNKPGYGNKPNNNRSFGSSQSVRGKRQRS